MRCLLAILVFFAGSQFTLVEEIEEERYERDQELRSSQYASPLTAIAQTLVEPDASTQLSRCPDGIRFITDEESTCRPSVEIRFERGRFLAEPVNRTKGTWGPGTPFLRTLSITPGQSDIRGRLLLTAPESIQGLALYFSRQGNMGRVMLHDTRSETLAAFEGLSHYPVNPDYHFVVKIEPDPEQETIEMATTQGLVKKFKRLGKVAFNVPEGSARLTVFSPAGSPQLRFVPFRDTTNGKETYPVGRYLYLMEGPQLSTFLLDFNRAFNPYCAYSEYYNCPYPPDENHLKVPIPAGEKLFKKSTELD